MSHHYCVCQTYFQTELQFALGCLAGQRQVCKTWVFSMIQDTAIAEICLHLLISKHQTKTTGVCLLFINSLQLEFFFSFVLADLTKNYKNTYIHVCQTDFLEESRKV